MSVNKMGKMSIRQLSAAETQCLKSTTDEMKVGRWVLQNDEHNNLVFIYQNANPDDTIGMVLEHNEHESRTKVSSPSTDLKYWKTTGSDWALPNFDFDLLSKMSPKQKDLADYFRYYPVVQVAPASYQAPTQVTAGDFSAYTSANVPYSVVNLKQSDFDNGTLRIVTPGVYRFCEDVSFLPKANAGGQNDSLDNLMPNTDKYAGPQQATYDADQKVHPTFPPSASARAGGPYVLGFFAAIAVECDDVVIDLNGFTLRQSDMHNINQRFYANIELANAPFDAAGPANFTEGDQGYGYKAANRVLVMNGHLEQSSHHGIHGNGADGVMIHNVHFSQFEVAAVALNGTKTGIFDNVVVNDMRTDIKLLSTFSQARFIRAFLKGMMFGPDAALSFKSQTAAALLARLDADLQAAIQACLSSTWQPDGQGQADAVFGSGGIDASLAKQGTGEGYFRNDNDGYDGNVYGIVLNIHGPVVGALRTLADKAAQADPANLDMHMNRVSIADIRSTPIEIVGLSRGEKVDANGVSYHAYAPQTGPIGGVLKIIDLLDGAVRGTGAYVGTSLSDAQMLVAQSPTFSVHSTNSITPATIAWAESGLNIEDELLGDSSQDLSKLAYVYGGDSMNHHMKGNISLLISGAERFTGTCLSISGQQSHSTGNDDAANKGLDVGQDVSSVYNDASPIVYYQDQAANYSRASANKTEGARSTNIVVTASDRVRIEDMKTYVNASFSQNGGVRHVEIDQDFADKSYSLHNGSARVQIDI